MDRLEVKYQEEKFEEVPEILELDIIMARRQHDNKEKEIRGQHSSLDWTMGIRIYRKAGYKAIKNTQKQTKSATVVKIDIYTPHLSLFFFLSICSLV